MNCHKFANGEKDISPHSQASSYRLLSSWIATFLSQQNFYLKKPKAGFGKYTPIGLLYSLILGLPSHRTLTFLKRKAYVRLLLKKRFDRIKENQFTWSSFCPQYYYFYRTDKPAFLGLLDFINNCRECIIEERLFVKQKSQIPKYFIHRTREDTKTFQGQDSGVWTVVAEGLESNNRANKTTANPGSGWPKTIIRELWCLWWRKGWNLANIILGSERCDLWGRISDDVEALQIVHINFSISFSLCILSWLPITPHSISLPSINLNLKI